MFLGNHLYSGIGTEFAQISELTGGIILLTISLAAMFICLGSMIKIIDSITRVPSTTLIEKHVNGSLPGRAACLTGYLAILLGAAITCVLQSSSIFTSTLTPLVGLGIVSLERMYPLTLGANLGTTFTSLLAALSSDASTMRKSLQIYFCHLIFNLSGIVLFYPIPLLRKIPIKLAEIMGITTAKYKWFAGFYLIVAFLLVPAGVFGLSLAGPAVFLTVFIPLIILILCVLVVKIIQVKLPQVLPQRLRTWQWLPKPMRSLEPYDQLVNQCVCISCRDGIKTESIEMNVSVEGMNNAQNLETGGNRSIVVSNTSGTIPELLQRLVIEDKS